MAELREVEAILDSSKLDEEILQSALQALLFHQCLYEDWPHAPAYRIIARHLAQVQPIVGAFGYKVTHHPVSNMIVLQSKGVVYGAHIARLKKDETTVLLVLRLLYAEGVSSLDEYGRVEITTDDVHDRLRAAGDEPPPMPRLAEILKLFQRKGLVRIGDRDPVEQLIVLSIMPGITVLVPDVYVEALVQWAENQSEEERPPTGILGIAMQPDESAGVSAPAEEESALVEQDLFIEAQPIEEDDDASA